ncbi:MAG: hypothetical protein V4574_04880 [Pseudomonadota bacterium]
MIAPLPSQPGLQQHADSAPAKPDPRPETEGFAEILAAAAAVPAGHLAGPAAREHGPAIVSVRDLAPPQAGLTDPVTALDAGADPDTPQPNAHRFNENGFFGSATGAGSAAPEAEAAAPATAALPPAPSDPAPAATNPLAQAAEAPGLRTPAARRSAGDIAIPGGVIARGGRTQAAPQAAAVPTRALAFEAGDAAEPAEPVKPVARRLTVREPAARSVVHVALSELEQGIHVAARADGLDAADRVRLHDEITALLARHGLSARSIRISAPLRWASSQEKLK